MSNKNYKNQAGRKKAMKNKKELSHPKLREVLTPVFDDLFGKSIENKNDIAPIWDVTAKQVDELYQTIARRYDGQIRDMAWVGLIDDYLLPRKNVDLETKVVYNEVETTYGDLILTQEFVDVFKEMLFVTRGRRNWTALFNTKIKAHKVQFYPEGDNFKNPDVVLQLWFQPQEDIDDIVDQMAALDLDDKHEYPVLPSKEKTNITESPEQPVSEPVVVQAPLATQAPEPIIEKAVIQTSGSIVKDFKIVQGALSKVMFAVTQGNLIDAEKKEINEATKVSIQILKVLESMTKVTNNKPATTSERMPAFTNFGQQEPIGNWADA